MSTLLIEASGKWQTKQEPPVEPRVHACGLQVIALLTWTLAQEDSGCNAHTLEVANIYTTPSRTVARGTAGQIRSAG